MLVWLRPRPIGILPIDPSSGWEPTAQGSIFRRSQAHNILLTLLLDECAADEHPANRE